MKKKKRIILFIIIFLGLMICLNIQITSLKIYTKAIEYKYMGDVCQRGLCNIDFNSFDFLEYFPLAITLFMDRAIFSMAACGSPVIKYFDKYTIKSFYTIKEVIPRIGRKKYDLCLNGWISYEKKDRADKVVKYPIDFCYPVTWKGKDIQPDFDVMNKMKKGGVPIKR